jgi:hypothetical protein
MKALRLLLVLLAYIDRGAKWIGGSQYGQPSLLVGCAQFVGARYR